MDQVVFKKRLKQILIVIIVLAVIWAAWLAYYSTTFHVVSTDPNTNGIATESPYLVINFSKPILSNGLYVSADPSIITSYKVSGKTLTLSLSLPLNQNYSYTITIPSVSDTTGKKLTNITFGFTPKYINYSNLSPNQQKTILQEQSKAANNQSANFSGTNALISQGLSTEQVQEYEQAITSFSKSINLKLSSAVINQGSVTTAPLNPDGIFGINFSVSINGTDYSASFQYTGLTGGDLILDNPQSGAKVYDSGNISLGS